MTKKKTKTTKKTKKTKTTTTTMETIHDNNMMQCLLMASQGQCYVSPNPLVGAMLVHEGAMIGAGYHEQYGTAHAEVNCINSVSAENKHKIPDSILYVNLEPCNHYGKTPPCTDFIIAQKIKTVVIGTLDPNEIVNGNGIQKLRDNNITVITNINEQQCLAVNRRFFTYQLKKRPYIILKWAQTYDGFIAHENKEAIKITSLDADKINHTWRSQEDAIVVGYNTALLDNPQLNVRHVEGRNPVRIILDWDNELPDALNIFDNTQATIIINKQIEKTVGATAWKKMESIQELIFFLYENKTQSIIVEGGTKTIQAFINANLWDEARIINNTERLLKGYPAPILQHEIFMYKQGKTNDTINYFKHKTNTYL
jgi:diaminohydroxyphosphoribosylaminopyrimidine deaminase / 5-amino-6-(5-phosphoribosylamino)uracil reductase